MPEVVHRAVVFGTDFPIGDVDAEKDLNVVFKVSLCSRPSPPKNGKYVCRFGNVTHVFISE